MTGDAQDLTGLGLASTFVLSGMEPLRLVVHHEDGTWDFLCNTTADPRFIVTVHADEVFSRFPLDLADVRDMPLGHCAEREARGQEWVVSRYEEED